MGTRATTLDHRVYLFDVANRLAEMLAVEPDAGIWMDDFAAAAEEKGWVWTATDLRRTSHMAFAMDLFADSMTAPEWLSGFDLYLRAPGEYDELCQFMDIII